MDDTADMGSAPPRFPATPPRTYWLIAGLGLIWSAIGGYDYVMSLARDPAYLRHMPDAGAHLDALPWWGMVCWTIGVWGSVAGAVLMLLRSRWAIPAFVASVVTAVINFTYQFFHPPAGVSAAMMTVMPVVIVAILALQIWYCRRAARRGWLV